MPHDREVVRAGLAVDEVFQLFDDLTAELHPSGDGDDVVVDSFLVVVRLQRQITD